MTKKTKTELVIEVCMGSSCFSCGNNTTVSVVQKYVKDEGLEGVVALKGVLCQGQCKQGPIIRVNDKVYQEVDGAAIIDIIKFHLKGTEV